MGTTTNYELVKQENKNAYFSMDVLNENMDKIDNILPPTEKNKLINTKKTMVGKTNISIPASTWSNESPYTCTAILTIEGHIITDTNYDVDVSLILSENIEPAKLEIESYSFVDNAYISNDNTITFVAFDMKPTVDLQFKMEVFKTW